MGFFPAVQNIQSRIRPVSVNGEAGARTNGKDKGWKAKEDGYDDGNSSEILSAYTLPVAFSLEDQNQRHRRSLR